MENNKNNTPTSPPLSQKKKSRFSTKTDFDLLSKYNREPSFVEISRQPARDAKLFYHQEGYNTVNLEYDPKRDLVEKREPTYVDYLRKGPELHKMQKLPSDQPSTLDYDPKYEFIGTNTKDNVKMSLTTDRYSHFYSIDGPKSITNNIDYRSPPSALVDEPEKNLKFVKRSTNIFMDKSSHSMDFSKLSERKNVKVEDFKKLSYTPKYTQTETRHSSYYDMSKQSTRNAKTTWFTNPNGALKIYDIKHDVTEIPTKNSVNMSKTTGRKKLKSNMHDLSYNPRHSLVEKKELWSPDLFLVKGRDDEVKVLAKVADQLILRVKQETKKFKEIEKSHKKKLEVQQ
ncbi:hypothetical protein ABK040_001547 [Willaertia magna]